MNNIILIIPTYNEVDNIKVIYKKIRKYNPNLEVLFIDDNSPDGTLREIKILKKKDSKIFFVSRKKKFGIGSAHKFGIKWAVKNFYKICITMDSDLTHDPRLIPKMISYSNNYHLVQTNRFFSKSSMKTWPLYRKILTAIRYWLIYFLLEIKQDSSGAFRCYNFNIMDYKLLFLAKDNSYSFFWESIYILNKKNCKIKEIPINQKYRERGSSKIQIKDWFNGILYLFKIYYKDFLKK